MALEAALQALGGDSVQGNAKGPIWQGVRSYGTPDAILNGLSKTESSGNPYAINPDTKALGEYQFMPETAAALHKQGVKFNVFEPAEARAAADYLVQQNLAQNGGDMNKALASYGGFKTKNPSGYIAKVTSGASSAPAAPANDAGPLSGAMAALTDQAPATAQAAARNPPTAARIIPTKAPAEYRPFSKAAITSQMATGGGELGAGILNAVSGVGASIIGGWRGLATLASGGTLEDAAVAAQEEQENRTYQPETVGGQRAAQTIGLVGAPAAWLAKKGGELAQEAGASPAVATGVETAITAAPLALLRGAGAKPATMPQLPGANATAAKVLRLPEQTTSPAMVVPPPSVADLNIPPAIREKMAAQQTANVPLSEVGKPIAAAPAAVQAGKGAANVATTVTPATGPLPALTTMKIPDLAAVVDEQPVKGGLPAAVHAERQSVLERVGLPIARNSAIKGDAQAAATDFQMSKFSTEAAGKAAADQFALENATMKQHAASIVTDTGGIPGMDEGALVARGQAIAAPLDALKEFFQKAIRALYAEADKRSGGIPSVQPESFGKILNTDSVFAGKAPNQSLGNGIRSYLREQGIMDKEGAIRQITAQEAEGIKQYINSQYSYETSGLAGKIKGALDNDVLSGAGEDIYAAARALHAKRMQTLDNPNGISKIMEHDPYNPVNRATPFEKIPDTISRLSNAQYNHLLDTLRGMPEELQPQAQAAIKQIQAHWGEKLLQKGTGLTPDAQWNAPRVTEAIKLNSEKIANAFKDSPALLAKIEDLQKAGNILRVNAGYPGAAAQAANAVKRGVMSNILRPIGASVGGLTGSLFGPPGAAAGAWMGEITGARAVQSIGEKAALKRWTKGTTQLKDVAP